MFDQVAVSEAGWVFTVPPYVSVGQEHETASPGTPWKRSRRRLEAVL